MKKNTITGAAPKTTTSNKTTKTVTTTKTVQRGGPEPTGEKEKFVETSVKRRREKTGSKIEKRIESKTTTFGRGGECTTSTTTKTSIRAT